MSIGADYRCELVYLNTTEKQRFEARMLWLYDGVTLSPWEALCRPYETVVMARNPANELVGLCTVQPRPVGIQGGQRYYFYRTYIRLTDRASYLMIRMHEMAVDYLRYFHHPDGPVDGMLILVENPKMLRPGNRRRIERLGYQLVRKLPNGQDLWCMRFGIPMPQFGA